jgi:hypothetical protein
MRIVNFLEVSCGEFEHHSILEITTDKTDEQLKKEYAECKTTLPLDEWLVSKGYAKDSDIPTIERWEFGGRL